MTSSENTTNGASSSSAVPRACRHASSRARTACRNPVRVAVARTPVELVKLERLLFLNLLHNHPTLAVVLIGQQHERLREQRASGSYSY